MRKFFRKLRIGFAVITGFALGFFCTIGINAITGIAGLPLFITGQAVVFGYTSNFV